MKKYFKNLKLRNRLVVFLTSTVAIIYIFSGATVYQLEKYSVIEQSNVRMKQGLNDIVNELDRYIDTKKLELNTNMVIFEEELAKKGELKLSSSKRKIHIKNQQTKEESDIQVSTLTQSKDTSDLLYSNFENVDFVTEKAGCYATIFQRIDEGYVRISTSVKDAQGARAIGTYIPNSSPVAQAISAGNEYKGTAFVVNQNYLAYYKPIKINDKVEGILFVGIKLLHHDFLKKVFDRKYYNNGYPYMIDTSGNFLIHPKNEGQNASSKEFFKQIKANPAQEGSSEYVWPEDNTGKLKVQYFKYYKPFNAYISATIYSDDIFSTLNELFYLVIFGVAGTIVITLLLISYFIKPVSNAIEVISTELESLAEGKLKNIEIKYNYKDEISNMVDDMTGLVNGLRNTAEFAKEVGKGHFDVAFQMLSDEDELGQTLLEMRSSLKNSADAENERKKDDENRNWATTGFAKFAEILRQNNDSMEILSFNIIKNIVNYTGMNQGGIFIFSDNDKNHPVLNLTACYAFNRQKFLQKSIEIGEGLVGACYQEGKTIYLTDIPNEYIEITSGLGESNPKCIIIVPLKLNDIIFGIMELASFKKLEQFEIDFIERIGETIASTISAVKINLHTSELLEVSQQQGEEMRAQEEEMRQNLEEMHATQEEISRKEAEQNKYVEKLLLEIETLKAAKK